MKKEFNHLPMFLPAAKRHNPGMLSHAAEKIVIDVNFAENALTNSSNNDYKMTTVNEIPNFALNSSAVSEASMQSFLPSQENQQQIILCSKSTPTYFLQTSSSESIKFVFYNNQRKKRCKVLC